MERSFFITNNQYDNNGNKIRNKFVNNLGSEVTLYFSEPLHLGNSNKGYEMYVKRASIVYCTPNISSALQNNKLTYTFKDELTSQIITRTYTFDDGLYSLQNIVFKLSLFTSQIDNGNDESLIFFTADESTSRIYITFSKPNVYVDASATNSILLSLGFSITQGTYHDGIIGNFSNIANFDISDNMAQLNSIINYIVTSNISTGNYTDSDVSSVIEMIPIGKTQSFSLTEFDSNNPTKSYVNARSLDRLVLSLKDNNGNLVDMNTMGGVRKPELWSIELTITEKK